MFTAAIAAALADYEWGEEGANAVVGVSTNDEGSITVTVETRPGDALGGGRSVVIELRLDSSESLEPFGQNKLLRRFPGSGKCMADRFPDTKAKIYFSRFFQFVILQIFFQRNQKIRKII